MARRSLIAAVLGLLLYGSSADAQLYSRQGQASQNFTCSLTGVAAALAECQAIPAVGFRYNITSLTAQSTTATAAGFQVQSGTATACASNTTAVYPSVNTSTKWVAPGNGVGPMVKDFITPLQLSLNHAICVLGVATNTTTIQISGFVSQ
jgi:hypothetical protein